MNKSEEHTFQAQKRLEETYYFPFSSLELAIYVSRVLKQHVFFQFQYFFFMKIIITSKVHIF